MIRKFEYICLECGEETSSIGEPDNQLCARCEAEVNGYDEEYCDCDMCTGADEAGPDYKEWGSA